jgi:hypothetical protein
LAGNCLEQFYLISATAQRVSAGGNRKMASNSTRSRQPEGIAHFGWRVWTIIGGGFETITAGGFATIIGGGFTAFQVVELHHNMQLRSKRA